MLNAVFSGKAGHLNVENENSLSWKSVVKVNEDILTASVFERLSYLPSAVFWSILRKSVVSSFPSYQVAELTDIQFWPSWDDAPDSNNTVEPDVFLRFHVGDPKMRVDIIVEAKRHDAGTDQYSTQWYRQCRAYLSEYKEDKADHVFFLAIGGLGENEQKRLEELAKETRSKLDQKEMPTIEYHGGNWARIAKSCNEASKTEPQVKYVISDIVKLLAFSGYRNYIFFDTLQSSGEMPCLDGDHCFEQYDFGDNDEF